MTRASRIGTGLRGKQEQIGSRWSELSASSRNKSERFLRHLEPLQRAAGAYCRRMLIDRSTVADALQSAVMKAFRDFDLYAEGTNFRAWFFRYVNHELLNRNRAAERQIATESPDELASVVDVRTNEWAVEQLLDSPEIVLDLCDDAIAEAVLRLPDQQRSIFLLRAVGEFPYREIAEILDIPIGTVMGLLARARERLRIHLWEYAKQNRLLPDE